MDPHITQPAGAASEVILRQVARQVVVRVLGEHVREPLLGLGGSAPHPTRSSVSHPAAQVQLLKTSHLTNLGEDFGPEIPWENLANVETFRPRRNGQLNKAEKRKSII